MCSVCHKKLFINHHVIFLSSIIKVNHDGRRVTKVSSFPPRNLVVLTWAWLIIRSKIMYPRWYHKKDLRIRFSHLEHSLVNSSPTEHIFFFGKLASLLIITLSSKCCNDMQQYTPWLITTKPGTLYSRNYYSLGNTKAVQHWVTRYAAWGR